ncbi:MAG: hypothetical protein Q9195_007618 [Heterodermia aff. obscurata]
MASTFKDARKTQPKSRSNRCATITRKLQEPERRRQVFLKRVKDASDHRRWQTRSDQILRKDFLSQQKQWEAKLARSAPDVFAASDDDDDKEGFLGIPNEVEMVDEILTQEDREVEALVALLDQEVGGHEKPASDYDNDDEVYDRIFIESVTAAESSRPNAVRASEVPSNTDLEMDTSD